MNTTEPYHGWFIELIPQPTGYSFRCWLPEQRIALSDRKTYPTLDQALRVAKVRADLEAVSWALLRFLNEVYGHYYLTPDEHVSLSRSILEFVSSVGKKCR
ncbi:MAG TPA: hypothetical protein V6D14_07440 [Coleofasciculaceae cyanobacterium]|jgi:hypothetical protein